MDKIYGLQAQTTSVYLFKSPSIVTILKELFLYDLEVARASSTVPLRIYPGMLNFAGWCTIFGPTFC